MTRRIKVVSFMATGFVGYVRVVGNTVEYAKTSRAEDWRWVLKEARC
jgi:hypothetical protein